MRILFKKSINLILDYPRWIITGVSVITLVMLVLVNQLKMDFSIEQLFALNDPAVDRYFEFLEEFEREDNLILLLYECSYLMFTLYTLTKLLFWRKML